VGFIAIVVASLAASIRAGETSKAGLPKVRVAADGRTFVTAEGKPFVPLGVNYFRPGTGWAPQLWKKFDAESTRRDFAKMKELGVNCVRVFLSYGSFFTNGESLDPDGLAKLDQFLAIAEEAGIYVHPTGPDHWEGTPAWAHRDRIADPQVLDALEKFWKQLAARYRGRSVLFAYDLLNEPEVGWDTPAMRSQWNEYLAKRYGSAEKTAEAWGVRPDEIQWAKEIPPKTSAGGRRLLDYQHFREEVADRWTSRQASAIKAADPQALVTVGMIQWSVPALVPGLEHYAAFRPQRQAKLLDFLEIHFYPLAAGFYEYKGPDDEAKNLAYLESVVREVAATGKPVVVAEFGWYGGGKLAINGGVHPAATDEQQAAWCRRAVQTTQGLATGWLNWGLYDHPEARDVTELTGLLTVEGKPKAWARSFQALSAELSGKTIAPAQLGPRPALDWDRCITSGKAGQEFRDAYLRQFRQSRAK
jgi:hypothetical protein